MHRANRMQSIKQNSMWGIFITIVDFASVFFSKLLKMLVNLMCYRTHLAACVIALRPNQQFYGHAWSMSFLHCLNQD